MGVARESRRVGRPNRPYSKDTTSLAFQVHRSACGRVAIERRSWRERIRGTCDGSVYRSFVAAKQRVVFRPGKVHGGEKDRDNQL